jgi:hypothetical protein
MASISSAESNNENQWRGWHLNANNINEMKK